MSLRVDLEKALDNLRTTLHNLDNDIKRFEDVVENHLNLSNNKIPPKIMTDLSNALIQRKDS